jgi:hypothetical protein
MSLCVLGMTVAPAVLAQAVSSSVQVAATTDTPEFRDPKTGMVDGDGDPVSAQLRNERCGLLDGFGPVVLGPWLARAPSGANDRRPRLAQTGGNAAACPTRCPSHDRDASTQRIRTCRPCHAHAP